MPSDRDRSFVSRFRSSLVSLGGRGATANAKQAADACRDADRVAERLVARLEVEFAHPAGNGAQ